MSFTERIVGWRSRRGAVPSTSVTAVVLSGGSVFGAVQVGQLRALFEAGVVPDLIVGCSVGALNAAFLAARPDADRVLELADIWQGLRSRDVFELRLAHNVASIVRGSDHLCAPDALRSLIDRLCPLDDLSDGVAQLEVVTTDLDASAPKWWSSGPAAEILLASAALPGIFPPVTLEGHRHVDGGVLQPVPTAHALELGATEVYVCDVSSRGRPHLPARLGALSNLLEAFNVARFAAGSLPDSASDPRVTVLPAPPLDGLSMLDFGHTNDLIASAYELTTTALADSYRAPEACFADFAVA